MTSVSRPPDFPASTHQLHRVPQFREHYDSLSIRFPEPVEGGIRLAGTRRCYKVMIGVYAMPPHAVGLDIWAPTDDARLRIGQHRDMWGRINVEIGAIKFDAALGSFVSMESDQPDAPECLLQ